MSLLKVVRSLFGRRHDSPKVSRNTQRMADATTVLDQMRGDRISPQPAENGPSTTDNIAAAAKDYGLSMFSGETDALAGAAKSYRAPKTRRQRKLEG